jgi:hypothetical protein
MAKKKIETPLKINTDFETAIKALLSDKKDDKKSEQAKAKNKSK